MPQEPDRRGNPRATFRERVELALSPERRRARACDLSPTGLGLSLSPPHPPTGHWVEAEFALPGFRVALSLPAVVAWSHPESERIGIRFRGVSPDVAELLDNYVAGRV